MATLNWLLVFVWLCCKVIQTETSSWTATVPSSVTGLRGSCVVIPCSYNYPDPGKDLTKFTAIWFKKTEEVIYHSDKSKIPTAYQTRTSLVGDVTQKNCSLKIDSLQQSDQGPFFFRIEIEGYEQYSYKNNEVSITITEKLNPSVSVTEEVVEGQTVSASCSVSHSCPASPPEFAWNHTGDNHVQSQKLNDGQWKTTSTLTFNSTRDDHNKSLSCTVTDKGGLHGRKESSVLKVKHAPVNVKVKYTSDVQEGGAVELRCSSEAHPPANSYQWHNESNAPLHLGASYLLRKVSRHTGALYCTAINTVGRGKSGPVQFNVSFAPEIQTISCSSEGHMVKCVCIVESNPPSKVQFVLSDRVLPSTKTDIHGFATIGTLRAEPGSSEFVHCQGNNPLGSVNVTFTLPSNGKFQDHYLFIIIGASIGFVILLIVVVVVIKCKRRTRDTKMSNVSSTKKETSLELHRGRPAHQPTSNNSSQNVKELQKQTNFEDACCPDDHIYGNTENYFNDSIYANT